VFCAASASAAAIDCWQEKLWESTRGSWQRGLVKKNKTKKKKKKKKKKTGSGRDEQLELRSDGAQAHQCDALLCRELHKSSGAQPNHRVSIPHSPTASLIFLCVCVCVFVCVFFFKFFFSLLGVGLRFVVCGQSILPAFSCWIVCITISGEHGAERNSLSEERVTGQEILDLRLLFRKCTRIEIHLLTPAGLQVSEERGRGINDFQGQAGRQMDVVRTGFCGHLQLLVFFFFGKTFRP